MYPASFDYVAPATLEEALDILGRYEDDAKVLAGGQSLIPLMKLRFAAPRVVVDINRLAGLGTLAEEGGGLRIGALVRHKACETSVLLGGRWGTLGAAAPLISDPIIRNLGTVCGSLAHADPQGDWGSALLAMDAEVVARGPDGTRTIPLRELFQGPFVTSLEPTEIITEVRVPDPGQVAGGTYLKLERKVGDFATVGVAVHLSMRDGRVGRAGIALTAVGPTNLRATAAEEALAGSELSDEAIAEAARLAAEAAQPYSDTRGSADYKRTVVRVFTERGLRAAAEAVGVRPASGASPAAGWAGPTAAEDEPVTTEAALEETDRQDYFSGEETIAGVMEELEEKPGGPDGGER
jgi:carbon-monoxide dehydrogenase medium subunit